MAMSLFQHRMIKTTDAKAKALRPLVDRLISTAKK
ncbi:MAG: bL17 family ribosomal protein, partial [candidate division Zixibacteria bacterium]|nr:bL17 family ribosomal protein [candidate division Zixibacteria bacterium]